MMRLRTGILVLTLAATGCFSPKYQSGRLHCASGDTPCPDGYRCAADNTCWQNGENPDLSTAVDMTPDSNRPIDFSIPDGNHLGHVTTAGGGAIGVQATGTHQLTLSIGQSIAGTSTGAHSVEFGVLRGTVTK